MKKTILSDRMKEILECEKDALYDPCEAEQEQEQKRHTLEQFPDLIGEDIKSYMKKDVYMPIHLACQYGFFELAVQLLEEGAFRDSLTRHDRETPLIIASAYGHISIVDFLTTKKTDIKAFDINKRTAFWWASRMGHLECVSSLLREIDIKDVNASDFEGNTPLLVASEYGYLDIVKKLLKAGAEVNKSNKKGRTPLMMACQYGSVEIVTRLLDENADPKILDTDGNTAIWWSNQRHNKEQAECNVKVQLALMYGQIKFDTNEDYRIYQSFKECHAEKNTFFTFKDGKDLAKKAFVGYSESKEAFLNDYLFDLIDVAQDTLKIKESLLDSLDWKALNEFFDNNFDFHKNHIFKQLK